MKERISITIEKGLLEWLDRKVDQHIFANRSHGLEYLAARARERKGG
ncbi:MAG: ribbon-helix-helix domain-containing protein [Nanoarchaeota archaeon]|nr:ribbon-helix-helix domain-containing protein [Nanoarchaeota archaeon]